MAKLNKANRESQEKKLAFLSSSQTHTFYKVILHSLLSLIILSNCLLLLCTETLANSAKLSRKGLIDDPFSKNTNKESPNNLNANDQIKMPLSSSAGLNPFVFMNSMNSTSNVQEQHAISYPNLGNEIKWVNTNWTVRGIFGLDSQPFLNNFTAGLGVGAAIINRNAKNDITLATLYSAQNAQTSISPSLLANATWLSCPTCIGGFGGSISLQIAADQYRDRNLDMSSGAGSPVQFNLNQKWQLSEMLVFNMDLF
jgi:hypothetical protein